MAGLKETGVGILFFGALIGLGVLTIALTDFDLFQKSYTLTVYFDKAQGLQAGDNVRVMGVVRGKVQRIVFLGEGRHLPGWPLDLWVRATLSLDVPIESFLKRDFEISIRNANMLGGKVVDIDLGAAPEPLDPQVAALGLAGTAKADPFEELGDLIAENKASISTILSDVESVTGDASAIAQAIRGGEGVLHDLVFNGALAGDVRVSLERVRAAADHAGAILASVRSGSGVLGQAVYNSEWAAAVEGVITGASGVVQDVRDGRGILGQALYNPEWPERISAILAAINGATDDIAAGRGALGLVLRDEAFRNDLAASAAALRTVLGTAAVAMENVAEGRGVLGLLLADEVAAAKVRALLDAALLSIEDAREAAPLSSLGSFLFGSF